MSKRNKFHLQTISYRWGNVNHQRSVHHTLSILPLEIKDTWKVSKQISKLFFQIPVRVFSILGKTEGGRKVFFEGVRGI